ncbi:HAD family hydrolase [Streptomyces sp. NPDC000594]|uniref:HAD family hydrolase n=1 Tax=Streptomyces sp. NPDC000594 TaxID=3154261 RepID=UPI00331ED6C8
MNAAAPHPGPGPVKAVILDFYGTLVHMVPPLPPSHASVFHRRGLGRYADGWGDQWATGPRDGEEHLVPSRSEAAYRAWEVDRLRRRALDLGVPEEEAGPLAADLDRATKSLRLAVYPEVTAVLTLLRERGLTVALCSNWYWDLDRAVAGVGLDPLVDTAVTSARAGARKPHPRIYRAALEACGVDAEAALFVGDMWESDVLGPLAQGIRAVHLHRPDRAVEGTAPPLPGRAHRISSLQGLQELL